MIERDKYTPEAYNLVELVMGATWGEPGVELFGRVFNTPGLGGSVLRYVSAVLDRADCLASPVPVAALLEHDIPRWMVGCRVSGRLAVLENNLEASRHLEVYPAFVAWDPIPVDLVQSIRIIDERDFPCEDVFREFAAAIALRDYLDVRAEIKNNTLLLRQVLDQHHRDLLEKLVYTHTEKEMPT